MLDIKYIRENREKVQENANNKNVEVDVYELLELDDKRRNLTAQIDELRAEKNTFSNEMKSKDKPDNEIIEKSRKLKSDISELESQLAKVEEEYIALLKTVPNMSSDDTPIGKTEEDNQVVYENGDKPQFDFEPKNHWDLALSRGWIDKERAAKVAGARFAYIKGDMVKLQLALMQYVIDTLTDSNKIQQITSEAQLDVVDKPFIPIMPPYLIKTDVFDAMDRLEPSEDRYKIDGEELWLQGSAEHVMGSMHADETLSVDELPLRYIGYATSFRKEAGTYGKDMEGIIRMHQFDKLEMEIISTAEQGMNEHLLTIAIQEHILQSLGLPYQKILKCTADIGKPNFRGVDMDTWLPGQGRYRETHTADYMTDYQARRLNTKVRINDQTQLVYTIDATAMALGRMMVAIFENYQLEDGKIAIPEVLKAYLGGASHL